MCAMSYQCLDHGWKLDSEVLDGLEHLHQSLSDHPLQDDVQGNEYPTSLDAIAIAGGEGSNTALITEHLAQNNMCGRKNIRSQAVD